jgi:hypothetical protein
MNYGDDGPCPYDITEGCSIHLIRSILTHAQVTSDKTGNVNINITFRHVYITILALEKK